MKTLIAILSILWVPTGFFLCMKFGYDWSYAESKHWNKFLKFILMALVWAGGMLLSMQCQAQLTLEGSSITLHADTMSVKEAFKLLNYMVPKGQKINKVVIKDGKEWYQSKWLINRMLKRYAYTEMNGKVKLVRI